MELYSVVWKTIRHHAEIKIIPEFTITRSGYKKPNKRAGLHVCKQCGIDCDTPGQVHEGVQQERRFASLDDAETFKHNIILQLNRATRVELTPSDAVKIGERILIRLNSKEVVSCIRLPEGSLLRKTPAGHWIPFIVNEEEYTLLELPKDIMSNDSRGNYNPLLSELKDYTFIPAKMEVDPSGATRYTPNHWTTGKEWTTEERAKESVGRSTGGKADYYYDALRSRQFAKSNDIKGAEELISRVKQEITVKNTERLSGTTKQMWWGSNSRTSNVRIRKELWTQGEQHYMLLRVLKREKVMFTPTQINIARKPVTVNERSVLLFEKTIPLSADVAKRLKPKSGKYGEDFTI